MFLKGTKSFTFLKTNIMDMYAPDLVVGLFFRSRRSAYFIKQERVLKTEETRTQKPTDKQTNKTEAASNRNYRSLAKKNRARKLAHKDPVKRENRNTKQPRTPSTRKSAAQKQSTKLCETCTTPSVSLLLDQQRPLLRRCRGSPESAVIPVTEPTKL